MEFADELEESPPEYNLKWNSHHATLVSVLDSLLKSESLVDVTLACEGQFVNVHRIVLFACSTYFEELLSQQPKKQAIIFLKDVSFANLTSLIHFMYRGEVQVSEDQLPSFMQTAEALQIKGLLVFDEKAKKTTPPQQDYFGKIKSTKGKLTPNTRTKNPSPVNMPVSPPASVHSLPDKSLSLAENHSPQTVIPVEALENLAEIEQPVELTELRCMGAEYAATSGSNTMNLKQETTEMEDNSEQGEILLERRRHQDENSHEPATTSVFQKEIPLNNNTLGTTIQPSPSSSSSSTENLRPPQAIAKSSNNSARRRHVNFTKPQPGKKGKFFSVKTKPFSCEKCQKKYQTSGGLRTHVKWECGMAPSFQCSFCNYLSKYRGNLKTHMKRHHDYSS